MTPSEKAYMRGVEVADRLLNRGVPVLGVKAAEDGQAYTLFLAGETSEVCLPLDTNMITALAYVQATTRGEAPQLVAVDV